MQGLVGVVFLFFVFDLPVIRTQFPIERCGGRALRGGWRGTANALWRWSLGFGFGFGRFASRSRALATVTALAATSTAFFFPRSIQCLDGRGIGGFLLADRLLHADLRLLVELAGLDFRQHQVVVSQGKRFFLGLVQQRRFRLGFDGASLAFVRGTTPSATPSALDAVPRPIPLF